MNTPVNFELAKLLKEKGYNKRTPMVWLFSLGEAHLRKIHLSLELNDAEYNAPTIAEVIMWIYEKHNIWIYSFNEDCVEKTFGYNISLLDEEEKELYSFDRVAKSIYSGVDGTRFKSPTEAYEAAIQYCLNNLINQ